MGISLFDGAHWAAAAVIEVAVLAVAIRRKLFVRLPVFTVYLGLLVANEVIVWLTYRITGISSLTSAYVYWLMQGLQIVVRAVVVFEICRVLLSPYRGVWKLCRPFLIAVAALLVASAAIAARQSGHLLDGMVLTGERGLELTIVAILVFGLAFCRYYGIRIERHLVLIGLGLGFYSAVQVANNTFGEDSLLAHFAVWKFLRMTSFNVATILWFAALWKPLPAPQAAPTLLESQDYKQLAPQMTSRLRELNARLLEMWK